MGLHYKNGADHFHSLGENLEDVKKKYSFENGYFGEKGDSSSSNVRHIESDDPLAEATLFYDTATYGGIEVDLFDKNTGIWIGKKTKLADGTVISWRPVSSSDGSPAVDINVRQSNETDGVKTQKLHFINGGLFK